MTTQGRSHSSTFQHSDIPAFRHSAGMSECTFLKRSYETRSLPGCNVTAASAPNGSTDSDGRP